jgi:hypothetical protein
LRKRKKRSKNRLSRKTLTLKILTLTLTLTLTLKILTLTLKILTLRQDQDRMNWVEARHERRMQRVRRDYERRIADLEAQLQASEEARLEMEEHNGVLFTALHEATARLHRLHRLHDATGAARERGSSL